MVLSFYPPQFFCQVFFTKKKKINSVMPVLPTGKIQGIYKLKKLVLRKDQIP
jgi:hypothetical protein